MNWLRLSPLLLAMVPSLCFGQRQEIRELQRDMALLSDQVRTMQRSLDENMAAIKVLIQQSLDSTGKMNTTVAVLDNSLREREKNLANPVATVGTKVDQMASEFQALRDSIMDLNARLTKLDQRVVDMSNTMKVMQSPPPPPGSAVAPVGVSAESLYSSALRDKDTGNYDLALQEFRDYLTYFGNTASAPDAQYYIGEILYSRSDMESALKAFDLVLEKYPENPRTPDAMYMKGQTLVRMGQRNNGAQEFRELVRRWPNSELAGQARSRLKELGLPLTTPARKKKK